MTLSDLPLTGALRPEVLDLLDVGSCVVDSALVVRGWSDLLQRRGVARQEALDRPLRQVLTGLCENQTRRRVVAAAQAAVEKGEITSLGHADLLRFPDPVSPLFEVVCAPLEGGGRAALLLKPACPGAQIRAHYERILDSTPDGIMVIDPDRRVRIFNKACGELLGRDASEVIRTNCVCGEMVNCHMEDGRSLASQLCPAREIFQGSKTWSVQEMLVTNSRGQERWVETTYSGIEDEQGRVQFVVGIIRDVHERKMMESKLHQTEKLAAMGQLTAGIAHEIKNPLGIILSAVEIILDGSRPREMQVEAATFIREEVRRLDQRLRSFLEFARPHPPQAETAVLNGLVRRSVRTLEPAWKNIAIEMQLGQPEAIVHLDPHQFQQVFTNLLLNAAEAMGGQGRVLVRTSTADSQVLVEIHDSGPGIEEAHRSKVFDPFFTTKAHGTGLGLSIVYQIVTACGGSVEVGPSRELGGARFALRLPYQAPAK